MPIFSTKSPAEYSYARTTTPHTARKRFKCLSCGGESFYLNTKGWEVEATCSACSDRRSTGDLEEETICRSMRNPAP